MKNYLTIYLQYINGNPKISINIKANHSLILKKNLTNRLTIDERRKNFDVRFVTQVG